MPLSIHPVDKNDIPRIVDIFLAAMGHSPFLRATGDVPNPGGYDTLDPPTKRELIQARYLQALETSRTIRVLKTVDDETGEIVAFAKWLLFTGPEGLDEWREMTRTDEKMGIPTGANPEGYRYSWEIMYRKYRVVFGEQGREHYHLALLATDPAHERRGAGSMLVNWGCQLTDKHGLECHLESTQAGHPVYMRKGFVDALEPIVFDVSQFTGREGDRVDMTPMIRVPQDQS